MFILIILNIFVKTHTPIEVLLYLKIQRRILLYI